MVSEVENILFLLVEETAPSLVHTSHFPVHLQVTSSFTSNVIDFLILGMAEQNQTVDAVILSNNNKHIRNELS